MRHLKLYNLAFLMELGLVAEPLAYTLNLLLGLQLLSPLPLHLSQ